MAKRILYVEDHFNNMLLVKRIVQAEGHEFLSAADGESGWVAAVESQPDLIFVDLRLPGMVDGYELLRRLKADARLKHVPAVVLTAYGHGDAEEKAIAAGCDGFLHKPADIQQVREVIRQYVGPPARPPFVLPPNRLRYSLSRG
ncbi:MAG: response regulator [Chloroflexi bacterium]|nr:response regulator [Chloroflexota bacterium]MCI0578996.1 response regulator [Chloroflexota bacterium]MCI0644783.1 response regulator [Chloroflexota bacterium]MCI0731958.1 response regulator [Chloroflexota bacterium]